MRPQRILINDFLPDGYRYLKKSLLDAAIIVALATKSISVNSSTMRASVSVSLLLRPAPWALILRMLTILPAALAWLLPRFLRQHNRFPGVRYSACIESYAGR
jgi:hypothetical protein